MEINFEKYCDCIADTYIDNRDCMEICVPLYLFIVKHITEIFLILCIIQGNAFFWAAFNASVDVTVHFSKHALEFKFCLVAEYYKCLHFIALAYQQHVACRHNS